MGSRSGRDEEIKGKIGTSESLQLSGLRLTPGNILLTDV